MSNPKYFQEGFDKQLSHAIEECGEFLTAAGKTQRWGTLSVNPELPEEEQETNINWLIREARDVREAINRLLVTIERNYQ